MIGQNHGISMVDRRRESLVPSHKEVNNKSDEIKKQP